MSSFEKCIGAKITEYRLSQKLTQAQLAERVDLSVETVSRLERGVSLPSIKTMDKIAHALNTPLKSFFDYEEETLLNQSVERELAKLTAFIRTLKKNEISRIHKMLKMMYSEKTK